MTIIEGDRYQDTPLFTLQPVVMDYATNLLIAKVCEEIETEEIALFNSHALLKAQALHSASEAQIRLILKPVKDRLLNTIRDQSNFTTKLSKILSEWQIKYPLTPGYAAANIINLLGQLNSDLSN